MPMYLHACRVVDPAIQQAAEEGDSSRFALPRPLSRAKEHRFNFSFSGLKTAVLNLTRELEAAGEDLTDKRLLADLAASFQEAVAPGLGRCGQTVANCQRCLE